MFSNTGGGVIVRERFRCRGPKDVQKDVIESYIYKGHHHQHLPAWRRPAETGIDSHVGFAGVRVILFLLDPFRGQDTEGI